MNSANIEAQAERLAYETTINQLRSRLKEQEVELHSLRHQKQLQLNQELSRLGSNGQRDEEKSTAANQQRYQIFELKETIEELRR